MTPAPPARRGSRPRLDYAENRARLAVRIRAHTRFANFQLEDWLGRRLAARRGTRVLDIGCGDGNFFPVYARRVGPSGLIVGFDSSPSLLEGARRRAASLRTPCLAFRWDFNDPLPLLSADFECALAPFCAYYANDARAWTDEALRVTRPGGQLLLLGPAEDNAAELYALNEAATGVRHVEETEYTTRRLSAEFLPALRRRLGRRVRAEVLDRRIDFPDAREFARYYLATWLYEKTARLTRRPLRLRDVAAKVTTTTLSKRVLVLEARP